MARSPVSGAQSRPAFVDRVWNCAPDNLKAWALAIKYGATSKDQWMREVMNRAADDFFAGLPPQTHDAVEVSGRLRADLPWRSYCCLEYPEFDLSNGAMTPESSYDIVICEQVLEHVPDPVVAVRNLRLLCRPGGRLYVSTPFLVKIHRAPGDYWRFTPDGLRILLERAGFGVESIDSWGNRACVRGNLGRWLPYRRWHSLRNATDFPLMVWAVARRED